MMSVMAFNFIIFAMLCVEGVETTYDRMVISRFGDSPNWNRIKDARHSVPRNTDLSNSFHLY